MTRLIMLAAAALIFAAGTAHADPFTIEQCQLVNIGLQQLDGYDRVVKDGQNERVVRQTYNLGPGLRLSIARNMEKLRRVDASLRQARLGVLQQFSGGESKVPDGNLIAYQAEDRKLMDAPCGEDLIRIKLDELKLSENPVPASVLSVLLPIVDQ